MRDEHEYMQRQWGEYGRNEGRRSMRERGGNGGYSSERERDWRDEERYGRGMPRDRGNGSRGMSRSARSVEHFEDARMVKVIEVVAESPHSWEDAANCALEEASRSLRNIKSIYVKDMQAIVRNGRIAAFRLNAKISFALDDEPRHDRSRAYD
jgi:flavin-binding protein dodecin